MSVKTDKMKAVFLAALEKSAEERTGFLDEACTEDTALRDSVEALLRAHDQADDPLLDHPAAEHLDRASSEPGEAEDSLGFLAPSSRPDSLGRLGHYEVLEVLGRGGFGIVFRAFDEKLQRVVAVKVLAPQLAMTSPPRKRFLREARSSAAVRHENVVQVHAVEERPLPYLVMDFIPGETLQQRLDRIGPLETMEVVRIGRQIAEGLAAAHAMGLIHRDIKPANILIEAGPHQWVKITDFGLARAADDASLTQSGMLAGTPLFMAPEQAQGETLDHRADLFSLGSVMYTMCSGRPPFRASNTLAVLKRVAEDTPRPIREIIPEVPQWLCDVITRLHAKKPEGRFATAQEVADLLARRLHGMQQQPVDDAPPPISATAPTLEEKKPAVRDNPEPAPANRPRSRPGRWVAAAAAAVLLLFFGGLGLTEATGVTRVRGTVIRLFSPEGTLVVEVDDPNVSVRVDGSDLVITGTGAKEIRLKPGQYAVEATKNGEVVHQELVTVEKNGKRIVRVSKGPPPKEKKAPDRRAAEYVLSIGGKVRVNGEERDLEKATELPREPFRLTGVILDHNEQVRAQVTDAGLANFTGCKHLRKLALAHIRVSDVGLAHFKDCKTFTHLHVAGTQVSDAGLAHFEGCKDLAHLILAHSANVRGEGLANFADCKNLTHLNLTETLVGDAGLANFSRCKNLTHLDLGRTPVTDAGLANFENCKNLSALTLTDTKVSDKGLAHFADCKDLTWLLLSRCTEVSDAGLAHFAGCKNLTWLALGTSKVSDKGLAHFAVCKNLTHLHLTGCTEVSDAGLAPFETCKNLRTLNVKQTKVTQKGIDSLKKALPDCMVDSET